MSKKKLIAVKNTEHKGVYYEHEFNKDIYTVKGVSYRKFDSSELNEALKWAGVKNLKTSLPNIVSIENNEPENLVKNDVYDIIIGYKNEGFDGVCITTKNFNEIILKINKINYLVCEKNSSFDSKVDNINNHLNKAFKESLIEKEKYNRTTYPFNSKFEILKFEVLSNFKPSGSKYIKLDNFWVRKKCNDIFEDKKFDMVCVCEIDGNKNDVIKPYHNFTLNCEEIISVQPIEIILPRYINNSSIYNYSSKEVIKVNQSIVKEIKSIFSKFNCDKLNEIIYK